MRLRGTLLGFAFFLLFGGGIFSMAQPAAAVDPLVTCEQFSEDDPLGVRCGEATGLKATDPRVVAARIIQIVLGLLGIIAVVLVIYAGFRWMTAAGNDDAISTAKKTLIAAVIGLIIILMAYTLTDFVLRNLWQATTGRIYR